ncbi:MAG: hypothetical protein H5U13_11460 [Parvibaculum sp.]|nr:hypothetical protein [Parvibaculum sp.]
MVRLSDDAGGTIARRLVREDAESIELATLNPPETRTFFRDQIAAVHRIVGFSSPD